MPIRHTVQFGAVPMSSKRFGDDNALRASTEERVVNERAGAATKGLATTSREKEEAPVARGLVPCLGRPY